MEIQLLVIKAYTINLYIVAKGKGRKIDCLREREGEF